MKKIVLESQNNSVVRVFPWAEGDLKVILRRDIQRIELRKDLEELDELGVAYEVLTTFSPASENEKELSGMGTLRVLSETDSLKTIGNIQSMEEPQSPWHKSLAITGVLGLALGISFALISPKFDEDQQKEQFKKYVVKIMKKIPKSTADSSASLSSFASEMKTKTKKAPKKRNIRRVGALAVLGRLNKSRRTAGVNLGAVKTSPGPGLGGGNKGSGGVQTSLYAKGMIGRPVGTGGNLQGGGGYNLGGGKGGGQDGRGSLSLIGSSGVELLPLGKESISEGGLSGDDIMAVIQKNKGQIRFCYEQGLQLSSKISGRVVVDFVIGETGRIVNSKIANSTLHSESVESCILMRMKSWKFPLPKGGTAVKVSHGFQLRRL